MSTFTSASSFATAAILAALVATPAAAADFAVRARPSAAPAPITMWDIAFGAAVMSDYNFRGISQSDRGASVGAYFEPRFKLTPNLELYAGVGGLSVKLPTTPTAEIDFYGGFRASAGPFAADIGAIYYYYPKESVYGSPSIGADTDFVEVYGKFGYTFNNVLALGANVFYSPDWLKTGASGTYVSGTAKLSSTAGMFRTPDLGAYLSGEIGHYFFGTPDAGFTVFDYTTWNAGFGFTYKLFTLDFRYHDTDLSRAECQGMTGDPWAAGRGENTKWCSEAFIVKLTADTTLNALK